MCSAGSRLGSRPAAGFTLLELLVVLVIIGVLATMVSLSVSGRAVEDRMQADSRRVEALLKLASDEAQAKGFEIGFRQTEEGFEFLTLDDKGEKWEPIAEGTFRPRQIEDPFYLELRSEGRLIKPVKVEPPKKPEEENKFFKNEASKFDNVASKKAEQKVEPQVFLFSTGEIVPTFTLDLKLRNQKAYYRIEGTELGEIKATRGEGKA
ncbi:MAG: type II secretion system minor pseudopilin GspH [Panacagrimonas sp.]